MNGLMLIVACAVLDSSYPVCNAELCPERENDFVWENDKFGMRAYGPGEYHRWSGFDVFNKNTASNVCLKWVHRIDKGNFHQNRGEGMDNYTLGASRGVGGIAMFADGEWKTYPNWVSDGVVSLFEDPKGDAGKDGSTMSAIFVAPCEKIEILTDHMKCRVLAFCGRRTFTYWAGASWSQSGDVVSPEAWHECVRTAFRRMGSVNSSCDSFSQTQRGM